MLYHFWGVIGGSRKSDTSAGGTEKTGLTVTAASWDGAIEVKLTHDEKTGKDYFSIRQIPWRGKGVDHHIAEGVVGE